MEHDAIEQSVLEDMLLEDLGQLSSLERLTFAHLLEHPGCTSPEIQAAANGAGVLGDVNLVLYRALERGVVARTGGRVPSWRIAPGQAPFGATPDGSTVDEVLRIASGTVAPAWSPAQIKAAQASLNVLRMTAFNSAELVNSLHTVVGRGATEDLWDLWYRQALKVRSSSIKV